MQKFGRRTSNPFILSFRLQGQRWTPRFSFGVVDDYGNGTIQLLNRGEFIHTANVTYELTTIKIHPDSPEDATALMCPHLITGFF